MCAPCKHTKLQTPIKIFQMEGGGLMILHENIHPGI